MLGLNGREWKKKKKRKILLGKICEGEWYDVLSNLLEKKQLFFSTSQQDSKKCENWRPFLKFFSRKFFIKKSNNEESKHNEKTHKERTKHEEKVKRISYFSEAFFFIEQKQGDKEDIFQKSA